MDQGRWRSEQLECTRSDLVACELILGTRDEDGLSIGISIAFGEWYVQLSGLRKAYGQVEFALRRAELRARCTDAKIPMASREPKDTLALSVTKKYSRTDGSKVATEVVSGSSATVKQALNPEAGATLSSQRKKARESTAVDATEHIEQEWQVRASGSQTDSKWVFEPKGRSPALLGSISFPAICRLVPDGDEPAATVEVSAHKKDWCITRVHLTGLLSSLRRALLTAYVQKTFAKNPLCSGRVTHESELDD